MEQAAFVALGVVCLAVQLAVLWGVGRRRPIGDEKDYIERGGSEDPYAPRDFLRPPVMPWLAAVCLRRGGPSRLRLVIAVVSWLSVAATAVAGWQLGGPAIAILAAALLAVQPERLLLGCHIWPDTLLAFTLAALCVVLTVPTTPAVALAAGGLCTLGVLIRIDFLATLPLLLFAWGPAHGALSTGVMLALLAPPLLALILLSAHNARRYGIPWPDTTWAFNLMVARAETHLGSADRFTINGMVRSTRSQWRHLGTAEVPLRGIEAFLGSLRPPLSFARAVVRRALTMIGPDTFVRMKLLPRDQSYADLPERPRRWLGAVLTIAFPALVSSVLVMAACGAPMPGSFAWPSLGLMAMMVLFHARTRFRVAILPAVCLVAAHALARFWDLAASDPQTAALVFAGGLLLTWALVQIRCSVEL